MERSRELPTVNHAMAAHEIYLVYQILPFFFLAPIFFVCTFFICSKSGSFRDYFVYKSVNLKGSLYGQFASYFQFKYA